jgi:predicted transcriptional regulator
MYYKLMVKESYIDLETGEILDGTLAYVGPRIKSPYSGGFFMTNQFALEEIAKDKELVGETLRVFLYVCSRLDFENYIQIPQMEISKDLQIDKSNVSKSMSLLESKGILLRGPRVGKVYVWRLNPHYGWKGKVRNMFKK